jgi:hypothetical protein
LWTVDSASRDLSLTVDVTVTHACRRANAGQTTSILRKMNIREARWLRRATGRRGWCVRGMLVSTLSLAGSLLSQWLRTSVMITTTPLSHFSSRVGFALALTMHSNDSLRSSHTQTTRREGRGLQRVPWLPWRAQAPLQDACMRLALQVKLESVGNNNDVLPVIHCVWVAPTSSLKALPCPPPQLV